MLQQFYQFETDVTAPDGGNARWHARYAPDETEIRRALTLVERRRSGPVKTALQSGVAAAVGVFCLVNYLTDPARPGSVLTVGVLCFVLAAISLLYSPLSIRSISRREAAAQRKVNLWVSDRGVGFGKKAEHYNRLAYEDLTALATEDLLVLIPGKNSLIAVPKCAVDSDCWEFLMTHLPLSGDRKQEKRK